MSAVAPTLQAFFTDRLSQQRQASRCTVASYRDSLTLLLQYVHEHTRKNPSELDWNDLGADTITAFLSSLESVRNNSIRTQPAADRDPIAVLLCRTPAS